MNHEKQTPDEIESRGAAVDEAQAESKATFPHLVPVPPTWIPQFEDDDQGHEFFTGEIVEFWTEIRCNEDGENPEVYDGERPICDGVVSLEVAKLICDEHNATIRFDENGCPQNLAAAALDAQEWLLAFERQMQKRHDFYSNENRQRIERAIAALNKFLRQGGTP